VTQPPKGFAFQLWKIAEVTICCPKHRDAVTKADSGDPGVVKLGSNDRDAAGEALENVEVALRFTK
jgi:hypothetical protein